MYSLVNSTSLFVTTSPQIAKPQGGKTVGNEKVWVSFKTETEAQNALNYIVKTKFIRALLAIIKIDQNGAGALLSDIPWLDWTEEWNDDKLNKHFDLNAEEINMINDIVDTITVKE